MQPAEAPDKQTVAVVLSESQIYSVAYVVAYFYQCLVFKKVCSGCAEARANSLDCNREAFTTEIATVCSHDYIPALE